MSQQEAHANEPYGGTGGLAAPATGGLPPASAVSLPLQDLSADALLRDAARLAWDGREVPALGGIPLIAKLGQGGMGAVYYGLHPRLGCEVAVKVLPAHLASREPELIQRFRREAQTASRIKCQHLVGVMDVNEERGLCFLVMEFVRGQSAGGLLRQIKNAGGQGLAEAAALDICIAAAEGLAAAHAEGVIHRDIKPDNIMIPSAKSDGTPVFAAAKLADLGLARFEESGQSLTGANTPMGTPGYMSPEQAVDAKSARKPADVFSMGATLYALLGGQAPFKADTPMNSIMMTIHRAPLPVRHLRADVSAATAELIDRCLAKNPAERYPDGTALCEALKVCRHALGLAQPGQQDALTQLARLQKAAETGVAVGASPVPAVAPPPAAVPVAGFAVQAAKRAVCTVHPEADAAFQCHRCGKSHCGACRRVLANGREVCAACSGSPQAVVASGFCERCKEQSTEHTPGAISTTNGVGRKFYGSADPCPECGGIVRTLWFVFIDFPLLPLGTYRYKPVGEEGFNSVRFVARKMPMRWEQVFATWFVGGLIAAGVLAAVAAFHYFKNNP